MKKKAKPATPGGRVDVFPYDDPEDPLFVSAVARAFAVLRHCSENSGGASIKTIVQATGLPQPTVWRLCHTLTRLGYLQRTDDGRVTAGLQLLMLGKAAASGKSLVEVARPQMQAFATRFGGAVSLSVRDGLQMVFLERIEGGQLIFSELRTGSRVSLAASSSGWATIAGSPQPHRDELVAQIEAEMPQEYNRVQKALNAALKTFPKKGLVANTGLLHPEVNSIGVPIGVAGTVPIAALTFGGPRSKFSPQALEDRIGPHLKELAHLLSMVPRLT